MQKSKFITPVEVADELGISKSFAYKIVRTLNDELASKGFMTVTGRVSRIFYEEKFYKIGEMANAGV